MTNEQSRTDSYEQLELMLAAGKLVYDIREYDVSEALLEYVLDKTSGHSDDQDWLVLHNSAQDLLDLLPSATLVTGDKGTVEQLKDATKNAEITWDKAKQTSPAHSAPPTDDMVASERGWTKTCERVGDIASLDTSPSLGEDKVICFLSTSVRVPAAIGSREISVTFHGLHDARLKVKDSYRMMAITPLGVVNVAQPIPWAFTGDDSESGALKHVACLRQFCVAATTLSNEAFQGMLGRKSVQLKFASAGGLVGESSTRSVRVPLGGIREALLSEGRLGSPWSQLSPDFVRIALSSHGSSWPREENFQVASISSSLPALAAAHPDLAKSIAPISKEGQKCRVWTASYGGTRAVIIRSVSDQIVNYTVLDVNEGNKKEEAEAFIVTYAQGGNITGEFSSQAEALDKAFELCPEG